MAATAPVLSATIQHGELVVFETHVAAGSPGTVTAEESAGWTDADWMRLARSRQQALRNRQRKAGMHRRMSPAYAAQVARQQDALTLRRWDLETQPDGTIDRWADGQLVGSWRQENVPGFGRNAWAYRPAGHADPVRYRATRPTSVED